MVYRHISVKDWKVHEVHWCDNHQKIEHSYMWATKGVVSILVLIDEEKPCVLTKKRA